MSTNLFSQSCPDAPELQDLEILCDYEDPVNLEAAANGIEGEWSVSPQGGNVFIYLGWLYYQGASPGDYVLRLDVDNAAPGCPNHYNFDMQVITTALVWPIPQPVCPGEAFYVGNHALLDEGFHEVYLPAEFCDSLVQVILLHDDTVCEDGENPDAISQPEDGVEDNVVGDNVAEDGLGADSGGASEVEDETEPNSDDVLNEEETVSDPIDDHGDTGYIEPGPIAADYKSDELIFPTAFSPDSNGLNDFFGLVNSDVSLVAYNIRVFDRWGSEVYKSENHNERWDGVCRGKNAPPGVYAIVAKAKTSDGQELWHKGSITLVR